MTKSFSKILTLVAMLSITGCGGDDFVKNPLDMIIKDIPRDHVFSIILNDMDVEGTFFNTYKHEYLVVEEKEPGKPEEYSAGWIEVSKETFQQHTNDMGMEVASRGEDGKLHKSVNPPGYNNYVGNSRYGHWENRGGSSFWAFYGQYAFMSRMFGMGAYPVHRSYYDNYRGNYYGTGRSYYGPTTSGRSYYGTNSAYNSSKRPNSTWSRNNSSFKQSVSGRTSRSGSRYGSSSRSRGGGYGK